MTAADWPAVVRIYEAGIAGGNATFESLVPSWEEWARARRGLPCVVARCPAENAALGSGAERCPAENAALGSGAERCSADHAVLTPGADEIDGSGSWPDPEAVVGWAALSPVSTREVYRGVGAVSIYVAPQSARRGVGRALLEALIGASEEAGMWTLEAGIFPENAASIALHERCGFRPVGTRSRVGRMPDGRWRDVLLYERRSAVVGCD